MRNLDTIISNGSENESIYHRIVDFAANVHKERAKESYERKKYNSFDEALKNTPVPNVMSVVKNIIMKKSTTTSSLDEKVLAMNYIVTRIMDITPIQFYAIWSTDFNKKYSLYSTIRQIIKDAPIDIKKECFFDLKLIFFKTVWPDMYEKYLKSSTQSIDIFYATEGLKSGLIHAGSTHSIASGKKDLTYGKEVDDILMDAICDVLFDTCEFDNIKEIFQYLGESSKAYFDKKTKEAPGICEIIEARGYTSLYDFYFLKCPEEFQKKYAKDFLKYRKECKLPKEPLLETIIEQFIARENELERE